MKNSNNSYRKNILYLTLLILSFSCAQTYAQQAISTAGGDGSGIGSFSYTIGQVVYTSAESITDCASILQGIQIPFETFVESCATDFTRDGTTNGDDFIIFLGNFGVTCNMPCCPTDLNADGDTDGLDFVIFLGNFGVDCN